MRQECTDMVLGQKLFALPTGKCQTSIVKPICAVICFLSVFLSPSVIVIEILD